MSYSSLYSYYVDSEFYPGPFRNGRPTYHHSHRKDVQIVWERYKGNMTEMENLWRILDGRGPSIRPLQEYAWIFKLDKNNGEQFYVSFDDIENFETRTPTGWIYFRENLSPFPARLLQIEYCKEDISRKEVNLIFFRIYEIRGNRKMEFKKIILLVPAYFIAQMKEGKHYIR